MLTLTIPATELYDEVADEFITSKEQTLQLEHSLVSLSKWESKWKQPFLTKENKTIEQSVDYIRCMTLTQNVPVDTYRYLTDAHMQIVSAYIEEPMTATILPVSKKGISREIITAEIIYYWMIAMTIPLECQKWHLNRLLTLINVCSIKNNPGPKKSNREIMEENRALNEARRKALNTKG